nr:MAG TPA: hypothetical protein [Caudoviricetes sp.]
MILTYKIKKNRTRKKVKRIQKNNCCKYCNTKIKDSQGEVISWLDG